MAVPNHPDGAIPPLPTPRSSSTAGKAIVGVVERIPGRAAVVATPTTVTASVGTAGGADMYCMGFTLAAPEPRPGERSPAGTARPHAPPASGKPTSCKAEGLPLGTAPGTAATPEGPPTFPRLPLPPLPLVPPSCSPVPVCSEAGGVWVRPAASREWLAGPAGRVPITGRPPPPAKIREWGPSAPPWVVLDGDTFSGPGHAHMYNQGRYEQAGTGRGAGARRWGQQGRAGNGQGAHRWVDKHTIVVSTPHKLRSNQWRPGPPGTADPTPACCGPQHKGPQQQRCRAARDGQRTPSRRWAAVGAHARLTGGQPNREGGKRFVK